MIIPAASLIESAGDTIAADPPALTASEQAMCAKELHVANPAFLRGLDTAQFKLAARAYYLGLKVAAMLILVEPGAKL